MDLIVNLTDARDGFGGKASHLAALLAGGFDVPDGFAIAPDAPLAGLGAHVDALGDVAVAVRSSAFDEDGASASFAGIYDSVIDVRGVAAVEAAIAQVRASALSQRALSYRHDGQPARMGVVVQRLVRADCAGVMFTADPVTGDRDACVLTAVRGLGEALVSGERPGEEWLVRDGRPVRRRALSEPVLGEDAVAALVAIGRRIAAAFGAPQDIEWVIEGGRISIVQARPITALPDRVEWTPPPGNGAWMRTFRWGEWLPDPVSPLFATWFLPRTQQTFVRDSLRVLGARIVGPIHAVVNGWYFHSGSGAQSALAMMPGMLMRRPRVMLAVIKSKKDPAAGERVMAAPQRLHYEQDLLPRYRALAAETVPDEPDAQIAYIDRVCDIQGELMFSITNVGGFAWKAEAAVASFFREHLRGVDGSPHELLAGLAPVPPPGAHLCCSIDWMHPTCGELGMAGGEPFVHEGARLRREELERACIEALAPKLRERFGAMLAMARDYAGVREQQSRDLTLAWPNVRAILRRLGERAKEAGAIDAPDDIFWLERDELADALEGRSLRREVEERRALWRRQRRLAPPLDLGKIPGFLSELFDGLARDLRGGDHDAADGAVKGMPASAGRATGRVRVVRTPADFALFAEGEVLVAAATAPAWTPLFARAAAVVTDGGSVAAHASLVAREYGIPAVVATGDATQRLHDGQLVTVDGTLGRVEVMEEQRAP